MNIDSVFVVSGSTGEYADSRDWLVRAFECRSGADNFAKAANDWLRERGMLLEHRIQCTAGYEAREEAQHPLDPQCGVDYTGTVYTVKEVPLSWSWEARPTS